MTEQQLRRVIQEELRSIEENVTYGTDTFYVIAVKNRNGQISVVRDLENGINAHKIGRAKRFELKSEAQDALDYYMEQPWAPDPRSNAEAYVAKVRAELERV
jgi:hypothetical protein